MFRVFGLSTWRGNRILVSQEIGGGLPRVEMSQPIAKWHVAAE